MSQHMPIPLERVHAWCFDLDGTLMDTDDETVEALGHSLRLLGKERAARLARRLVMFGETPMNAFITTLDFLGLDALLFKLRARMRSTAPATFSLVPGVKPLLRYLWEHDQQLAVVSTRPEADALTFLHQHGLDKWFSLVVTNTTTKRLKPHPEPILYAVQHLGCTLDACVMVGDTPVDMRSARRAGVWTIGVLCGFGEAHELHRAGAHVVLPSTADLLPMLDQTSEAYT
ncbi:MAG: HAD-IA family hydrolase [Chloroflexi bacterium]|jgi:HAD superfamily hydrolase (TIGR01509 family)|nr:HAD-IA family hydrolase [Chloroflexota bacterium]